MKIFNAITLFTITLFFGCQQSSSDVIISGVVKGKTPFSIYHTDPINNGDFNSFKQKIETDSLGNFQIKLPLKKASLIQLSITKPNEFYNITTTKLIIEPNNKYEITIHLKDKNEINSFNKEAQESLNNLANPKHIQIASRPFLKDSVVSKIVSKIDSLEHLDVSKFEAFYENKIISKDFLGLVKLDRAYYYTSLKATICFMKNLENERSNKPFSTDFQALWETCFKNDLLNNSNFLNTEWGYSFLENYLYYKSFKKYNFSPKEYRNATKEVNYLEYQMSFAEKHLPKKRQEFYKAGFLFMNLLQKNYEKELITMYDDFNNEFPKSNYTKNLKPFVEDFILFYEKINESYDKKVHFIENTEDINSVDELFEKVKGEKWYVDFWATWCGPCKVEFKHNEKLNLLLDKYGYKVLYVSIDREKNNENWLNMIKFFNLKGTHIRASKKLSKNISEIGVNYIPRYFIVNENGKIENKKAKKPSQLLALEKQLKELVN